MGGAVKKVVKTVGDVVEGAGKAAGDVVGAVVDPFIPDAPDIDKAMREQEKRAEEKAAEQQAEVERMEAEERRRRQSSLRRALEPRAGMFDLLGSSQRRDTLG